MSVTEDFLGSERDAHIASTEKAMSEAGVPLTEPIGDVDYFAFDVEHKVLLPDGKQYVLHKELSEGARKKYLNSVNRDAVIQRATGDMRVRMSPGDERHSLLKSAISGWNVMRGGDPVAFGDRNLSDFLEKAPPRIIDIIEKDVRKHNPWLLAEMSVEDIDKEIDSLREMREAKVKEEEGKDVSSIK